MNITVRAANPRTANSELGNKSLNNLSKKENNLHQSSSFR
jgi:hypothetical protein